MITVTSKTFGTEDGQAVLLPDEVAYDDDIELTIVRSGDVLTVYPTQSASRETSRLSLSEMFARLDALPGPGSAEVRDAGIWPERQEL